MQQKPGSEQLSTFSALVWLLLCLLLLGPVAAQQPPASAGVGIAGSWPSSLQQYVQTTVRVTLNTSACGQWGQGAGDDAQLVLQHITAKGGSLAFSSSLPGAADGPDSSSTGSADCTSFDFPVLLDGTSKHGNITARLLLPKVKVDLRLQEPITVQVPLLLSVVTPRINISADSTPFAVGVSLSRPAPAGGVTVQLKLGEAAAAKVEPWGVYWPEGAFGRRDFTLMLLAAPEHGVLTARLSHPSGGAVLHPTAAAAEVVVQSPIVSFTTNLGYYRGLNTSTAPRLMFKLTGPSAFPTQFAFSTYLLPGSRPSLLPCHPLAPSCSVADQEAVDNITLSGSRYITPGQRGIAPVELPVTWGRLPPEAELRVGVRIVSLSNCRVAAQGGDVAAVIFGTPPGHCPPGAVLATGTGDLIFSSNSSTGGGAGASSNDRPTYTQVAALQELALVLDHEEDSPLQDSFDAADNADRRHLLADSSSSAGPGGQSSSSSAGAPNSTCSNCTRGAPRNKTALSRAAGVAAAVMPGTAAAAKAAVLPVKASVNSSDGSSTDDSSSSRTLDLDPPFRPLVDRYIALLPPGPAAGHLMMSSSRWSDVVVVDTTSCGELESARYTVEWAKGHQLWREFFPLVGQKAPCWIRVHVFTRLGDGGGTAAPPAEDAEQGWSNADSREQGPGLKDPSAGVNTRPLVVATPLAGSRRPLQLPPGTSGDLDADAAQSDSSNVSAGAPDIWGSAGEANGSTSSSPSVWDLPTDFVLYRSYTVRFVPLRPPEQLSLRAITFSNNASVVIACGVPAAYEHLFVLPKPQPMVAAKGGVRPSSIMSSNYAAATSQAPGKRANSSSGADTAGGAASLPFTQLSPDVSATTDQDAASSSSDGSAGPPAALAAAPGVDVQIAYLLMKPPGSNGSSVAQDVAAAAKVPNRLRMQQFSVYDRASNRTVLWSRFTAAECAQDHYILLPMAQLKPDMRMVPELVDPEGFVAGVKIAMSAAAVALPGGLDSNSSSSSTAGSSGSSSTGSSVSHLGVPSEGSSSVSSWLLGQKFQGGGYGSGNAVAASAATAAVDGGKGFGGAGQRNLGDQVWCNSNSSSGVHTGVAQGVGSVGSSTNAAGSDADCRLQLPGLTAELPIILTADEGRSSRTYTMLLYSNATAATAVHDMVLPQEAAAGGGRAGSSSSVSQAADAAALTSAYFASRPGDWPKSPAQSSMCNVCPNGTYSTRTDALECKVCPPGKYAASPFSTTCLYCPPGSFSYYWGAPTCRTCLPGTYAATAGSLFCDICREGTTTRTEGATRCEVSVAGGMFSRLDDVLGSADVAILLSFGLLLDGTNLESVSRSLTGINGSSEGIVGVLVRGDTASALNISLGSVQVLAVQQIGSRQLLVNVSAALPVSTDQAAAAAQQDLSADPLIQRLIDDPNTFLRTTQTLGAESASVQDITTQMTQRARWRHQLQLHAILWPTLAGFLLLLGLGTWGWRRRRRRQMQMAQIASGRADPATAMPVGGLGGLFGTSLQQRGARGTGSLAGQGQQSAQPTMRWGRSDAAPAGPGWFYGDGFMLGAGGGAPVGDDLARMSVNSSDAGDVGPRHGGRGVAGAWQDLQRLLSSRVRIVFKVPGSGGGGNARASCTGTISPACTSSPGKSSCDASEADSMERGVDEYRVKVLVGSEDGSSSGHDTQPPAGSSLHQHDFCLREESFAARLRSKQQQQLQ